MQKSSKVESDCQLTFTQDHRQVNIVTLYHRLRQEFDLATLSTLPKIAATPLLPLLFNWPSTCKAFSVLALSQSSPSYEASFSPATSGSSSFGANSLTGNQAQSFSSSLSFSETLAGLQAENASSSSLPVSFPPSSLFQSSTPSYSTQSSNQSSNSSPSPASDNSQSVQAPSTDRAAKNSTGAQESARNGTKTDQSVKQNPPPSSSKASQQNQGTVADDSSSSPTADPTSLSPNQGRVPSAPPTGAQQTAATGTKAGDTGRQDVSKRHKKANEAAQAAGAGEAPVDSVAATLLAAANSSPSAAANGEAGPAASGPTDSAPTVTNKNNLAVGSNAPNALAFAVKLQSASSATGGSVTDSAANAPAPGLPIADSAGDQGLSKFAEQLQAVTGAAQLSQEPASLNGAAALAALPGTTGFAPMDAGAPPTSSGTETSSPQIAETESADADESIGAPVPLRSMQVQINGQDNQRIDLRLIERSGTLSMSVRSLDSTLNRSLQDHLPELMTKLADQPGQAEWWTPKTQMTEGGNASGHGGASREDSSGSQGQQSQTSQDSDKQQSGRQSNQPKWVEELAALGNTNTTARKETIWHQ